MKISACIIAKNEEKNITKCIDSLTEICDEIIVVDTGSGDNTVNVCKKKGAKVFHYNWNNNFGAAKNYALSEAKGQWIIFLDADEYIDGNSVDKIKKLIKTNELNDFNTVACKMINIDSSTGKIIDEIFKVRMFKNKDVFYEGKIHEYLICKSGKFNVLNLYKDITIYHTGYSSDIAQTKAKRNLEMMLNNLNNSDEDKKYYAYLSTCYFGLQDYENAIKYAKLHIDSGVIITGLESSVYKSLIDSLFYIQAPKEKIEKEILNAIEKFPKSPNFYCSYADLFLDYKQYDKALDNFLLSLRYNEEYEDIDINLVNGIKNQIYTKIAQIYELKNNYNHALEYYLKSLKIYKYEEAVFSSICGLIKNEESEEIINLLSEIYDVNNETDLKFLCYNLMRTNLLSVYSYYAVKYLKSNSDIIVKTYLLLFNNRYEEIFEELYVLYEKTYDHNIALLLISDSILIDKKSYMERIINIIKPSFKRIINIYSKNDNKKLIKEDINDYISVLQILINICDKEILNRYLLLKKHFQIDISTQLANIFKEYGMYGEAVKELEYYIETIKPNEDSKIYIGIGYCYYKLEDYKKAFINFKIALEKGYSEKDVYEFLNFMEENLNVVKI